MHRQPRSLAFASSRVISRSPLSAGLTHLDLFFKAYDETEGPSAQSEDARLLIQPLAEDLARVSGARELVFPGLLLECAVGKGSLVIDLRRWTTTHGKLVKSASRQATTLVRGLDGKPVFVRVARRTHIRR